MAVTNLKALVGKLNPTCQRGLEGAAGLCLSRTNYNVEIEHWLVKLLESSNNDLPRILRHYEVDPGRLGRELTRALDGLKTGNARAPELSIEILDLMREAWSLASIEYGAGRIRSGYLLAALLNDRSLSNRVRSASAELSKIKADELQKNIHDLVSGSSEDAEATTAQETAGPSGGPGPRPDSKTPSLDQFTLNLTDQARRGSLDPVVGRDREIRQVIDILTRRRQNNPILTGEAGVGKTAVVEGFALRIAEGDVPDTLKNVDVRTLDLSLLQAGAGVKGEFENRLKSVINEVKSSPKPIILFIDEAHTLIGAGGSSGQGDAANLLKPALARGELRTIAATTWMEYKKYFEADAALKRRFQVVVVDEPTVEGCVRMMRGLTGTLEKHHGVRILEEAVDDAVKLSHRYLPERQLPDKAVVLLDTACARVGLSQSATPEALEDCQREITFSEVEIGILEREQATGREHTQRLQELKEQKEAATARLEELRKRWEQEKALVEKLGEARAKLEAEGPEKAAGGDGLVELQRLRDDLAKIQGENPLVYPVVQSQAVAEVLSGWTGIPLGRMVRDEINTVLHLRERLEERVVGQSHGLDVIAERIQTSRAGLTDPRRPIGVFLLVGPSGVGKTETAMALADTLYGGDRNMVIVNMSEFKESHKVSNLTGAAKGLVGADEGGILTQAVRRKPHSVVLLDEVEKAHPDVQEVFYQVFDKGTLRDTSGIDVDFKNTIILLTSNVGTDTIMAVTKDPDTCPDPAGLAEAIRPDLLKSFKPALLGRMHVVPYFPLGDEVIKAIIKLQLGRIRDRVRENHRAAFTYDDGLVNTIGARCKEVESGARNIDHIITGTLLPEIAQHFLSNMAEGTAIENVHVGVDGDGKFVYKVG